MVAPWIFHRILLEVAIIFRWTHSFNFWGWDVKYWVYYIYMIITYIIFYLGLSPTHFPSEKTSSVLLKMKGSRPKPSQTPLLVGRGYPQHIISDQNDTHLWRWVRLRYALHCCYRNHRKTAGTQTSVIKENTLRFSKDMSSYPLVN